MFNLQSPARRGVVIGTDHAAELLMGFFMQFGDSGTDVLRLPCLNKRSVLALARSMGADQRPRHRDAPQTNERRGRGYWLAAAGELTAAAGADAIGAEAAVSPADPPLVSALRLQPAANDMDATSAATTTIRIAEFMALLPLRFMDAALSRQSPLPWPLKGTSMSVVCTDVPLSHAFAPGATSGTGMS